MPEPLKTLKVTYYRILVGTFEVEVRDGQDEDKVVRDFLPDAPADQFHVVFDDFAEIEGEDGKRCMPLTEP
jgi:hypothetical protein